MEIVVDDRERRGLLAAIERAKLPVRWERLHEAADVVIQFDGVPVIAFERKSGADLTSSIKTNHLFHQRDQLLDWGRRTGARVVLLVEDPVQHSWEGKRDGISSKYVQAVVASSTILKGLYLMCTRDADSTVEAVKYLSQKIEKELKALGCEPSEFWQRRSEGNDVFKPVVTKTGGRRGNFSGHNSYVAMLQQVPGLSLKRATAVASRFTLAQLVDLYRQPEDNTKKRKKCAADDPVADIDVGSRKLGKAVSARLRATVLGQFSEVTNEV
jgi:hypothetical protein